MKREQKIILMEKLSDTIIPLELNGEELLRVASQIAIIIKDIEFMMDKSFDEGVNQGYALREALEELALDEGGLLH